MSPYHRSWASRQMERSQLGANFAAVAAGILLALVPAIAFAEVTISSGTTTNMSCSVGVCAPTAKDAVLNVSDLETLLASGDVEVTTTGSGLQADNIDVKSPLSWSSANTLTLDAHDSIAVAQHMSVTGPGGLSLATNDGGSGGTLSFGAKGRVSFANLSSALAMDGAAYTLVNSIQSLGSAIANNNDGNYALADDYDASQDGTYSNTPITTAVMGSIEGLGNTISHIHVSVLPGKEFNTGGLFFEIGSGGTVENLGLAGLQVKTEPYAKGISDNVGGLVELNEGVLFGDHLTGNISVHAENSGADSLVGGLVAYNEGTIDNSHSTARIRVDEGDPGGLVGDNRGTIVASYATGSVEGTNEDGESPLGGIASFNDDGVIRNSYATGSVEEQGQAPPIGGFLGSNATNESVSESYSTGEITTNGGGLAGGFVGEDEMGDFSDCYWDTTTSGTDNGTGEGNVSGITGQTTQQLQSGLPSGFDSSIWAEKKNVNNGFPYLIANPPPEK